MKSYDMISKQGPSLATRTVLGVACLRPKALIGFVCVVLGIVLIVGAVKAQALVNYPAKAPEPSTQQAQIQEYRPARPLEASDPGVLQAPDLIARDLNESDAGYTARMLRLQSQVKAQEADAQKRLADVLRQVASGGHGQEAARVVVPAGRQPAQVRTPAVRVPAERVESPRGPQQQQQQK